MQPNIYAVRRCRGPRKRNQESCRNFSGTCAVINSILKRNWKFLNSGAKSADQWLLGYAHSMRAIVMSAANAQELQCRSVWGTGAHSYPQWTIPLTPKKLLGVCEKRLKCSSGVSLLTFSRFVNILRIPYLSCWYLFSLLLCYLKTLC